MKRALVAVVAGVLIGGGITTVTPAGAEVSQFAATNWKKIWKKKLQPIADKRYYTKSASDVKYFTKAEVGAAFANYYTKAQTDAAYALKGQSYTKAESDGKYQPVGNYAAAGSSYSKDESDAKYAPKPGLLRGSYVMLGVVSGAGQFISSSQSFGAVNFSARPEVHVIPVAGAIPDDCSGTADAPNADAGHLCIFEVSRSNVSIVNTCSGAPYQCGSSDTFGFGLYATAAGAGQVNLAGTWAARPVALAPVPASARTTLVNEPAGGTGPGK